MLAVKDNLRADLSDSCLPHSPVDDPHLDLIAWCKLQDLSSKPHALSPLQCVIEFGATLARGRNMFVYHILRKCVMLTTEVL